MKILLTNIHLTQPGGTETWIYTMARELARTGHEVTVFSFHLGEFAERMKSFCHLTNNSGIIQSSYFDLALVNHKACLLQVNPIIYRIFTSHSYFIQEERPARIADKYVAVTEEIQEIIQSEVGKTVYIIRNGIDCVRFSPQKPIGDKLRRVLYLSKGGDSATPIITQACQEMGLELIRTDGFCYNTEELINEADLVVTLGRGILESMACGRNVVSADWRNYQKSFQGAGFIEPNRSDLLKKYAFSGRNCPIDMSVEQLKKEFAKYDPRIGEELRLIAVNQFNVEDTAKRYLELYERR